MVNRLRTLGPVVLAWGVLGLAAAPGPAFGAIAFDAASRAATTSTGRTSLSWTHTIGGGADRALVVGVAVEDTTTADANVTGVTYNGVALAAVAGSKGSGGGTGIIQTQLFYLLGAGLARGRARTRSIVNFQGRWTASRRAPSPSPGSARPPPPGTFKVDTSGADPSPPRSPRPTAGAWVVDVVGSGNSGSFTAAAGQTERWDIAASGMTGRQQHEAA